jgi:hypothetical protein
MGKRHVRACSMMRMHLCLWNDNTQFCTPVRLHHFHVRRATLWIDAKLSGVLLVPLVAAAQSDNHLFNALHGVELADVPQRILKPELLREQVHFAHEREL